MRDLLRRVFLGRIAGSGAGAALAAHSAWSGRARAQGPGRVSGFDHVAASQAIGSYRALPWLCDRSPTPAAGTSTPRHACHGQCYPHSLDDVYKNGDSTSASI